MVSMRIRGGLVSVFLGLAVAGCQQGALHTEEVNVGNGALGSHSWTAWAFQSADEGLCMEIRLEGEKPSTLCGIHDLGTNTWRTDAPGGAFVGGTTGDQRAAGARITLADGGELKGSVLPATTVTTIRFLVIPVSAGAKPTQLDITEDDGTVIDSVPLT